MFDNGSDGRSHAESQSRALLFDVDEAARTVRLRRTFTRPRPVLATALGSVQTLTDGHVVVGWGESPYVTEFAPDGRLVADAAMAAGQHSYKTVRLDWKGFPLDHPAIAATRDPHTGRKTLYASWNGATEVTHWQVQVGSAASNLAPFAVVNRTGFETVISVEAEHRYAAVTALDASARKLATSRTVAL